MSVTMYTNDEMCLSPQSSKSLRLCKSIPCGAKRGRFAVVPPPCGMNQRSKFSRVAPGTFLSVPNLTKSPVHGGEPHCFRLSVAAIFTSRRCATPRQASTGILLHHESLFGLHRRRESFLD